MAGRLQRQGGLVSQDLRRRQNGGGRGGFFGGSGVGWREIVGWNTHNHLFPHTKAGKTTRVRALRDYAAAEEAELSFPKGAVMFVVRRYV